MNVQDRINNLGVYFKGLNVAEGIIYVTIKFPAKWVVSENTEDLFQTQVAPTETGEIYFFTNIINGFDKVFDAIDYNIEFNRTAQEKLELLKEKMDELTDIFSKLDIKTLKTLKITYKEPKKKTTKKKVENKEETKENIEEKVENKEEIKEEDK